MPETMTVLTRETDIPVVPYSNLVYEAARDLSSNYVFPILDATDEAESDE